MYIEEIEYNWVSVQKFERHTPKITKSWVSEKFFCIAPKVVCKMTVLISNFLCFGCRSCVFRSIPNVMEHLSVRNGDNKMIQKVAHNEKL